MSEATRLTKFDVIISLSCHRFRQETIILDDWYMQQTWIFILYNLSHFVKWMEWWTFSLPITCKNLLTVAIATMGMLHLSRSLKQKHVHNLCMTVISSNSLPKKRCKDLCRKNRNESTLVFSVLGGSCQVFQLAIPHGIILFFTMTLLLKSWLVVIVITLEMFTVRWV